jgi:GT2 family glycosyltransferase
MMHCMTHRNPKVMLAFAHPGIVHTDFMLSVLALVQQNEPRYLDSYLMIRSGPMITMTRNIMTRRYLESDCDWLWMVDSDIDFPPDTLDRMLGAADPVERPVLGASYLVLNDELQPVRGIYAIPQLGKPAVPVEPEPDTVMQVDATGTGCLLIHRSVLEKAGLFPFAQVLTSTCEYSEDLSFCLRVRELGFPVHVATGIMVGHTKPVRLG